ncbi:MAG TPA: DinB family protein [Bellilinea sp.]|nr:DinB family protein [Bellilinea sp.]
MTLFAVTQLRFARRNLLKILEGVTAEEAVQRLMPMNSLGWMLGHLASQEQANFILIAGNDVPYSDLHKRVGFGFPASTPELEEMRTVWQTVTAKADEFLDTLTPEKLVERPLWRGEPFKHTWGTLLLRTTYHYFYHTGEASAIRQMQGYKTPDFVLKMTDDEEFNGQQ